MGRPVDRQTLLDRFAGDTEFLAEAVDLLCEDGPAILDEIRRSVSEGDAEGLQRSAHAYKGMISNFCADRATEAALSLQHMGAQARLGDAGPALAELEAALEEALADLVAMTRGG